MKVATILFLSIMLSATANAQKLEDALALAYERSPKLKAERANVRSLDEEVARANAGYRPAITADADAGVEHERERLAALERSNRGQARGYGLSVVQPVFSGFRTLYEVREAKANVAAGRAALCNVEASILLEAVRVYMDVLRDRALVDLRKQNVAYLDKELGANRRRREEGTVTRTDVSQTVAQRSTFYSQLQLAEASLLGSVANFERVIGELPRELKQPVVPRRRLPSSLEAALEFADREHPAIIAASYRERASGFLVESIRGELLPTVQLHGRVERRHEPYIGVDATESLSVRGSVSIPIYSGGEIEARVRQAKEQQLLRLQQLQQVRLEVRSQLVQAWAGWLAANRRQQSDELLVKSSTDALYGVRKEERAGQRTVAEVLNAQLLLFNAHANLIATQYDHVVAAYTVLAATGQLSAKELKLRVSIYDPNRHYEATHRRWGGLTIEYGDGRKEQIQVRRAE